jgi:hypothetical protein
VQKWRATLQARCKERKERKKEKREKKKRVKKDVTIELPSPSLLPLPPPFAPLIPYKRKPH